MMSNKKSIFLGVCCLIILLSSACCPSDKVTTEYFASFENHLDRSFEFSIRSKLERCDAEGRPLNCEWHPVELQPEASNSIHFLTEIDYALGGCGDGDKESDCTRQSLGPVLFDNIELGNAKICGEVDEASYYKFTGNYIITDKKCPKDYEVVDVE